MIDDLPTSRRAAHAVKEAGSMPAATWEETVTGRGATVGSRSLHGSLAVGARHQALSADSDPTRQTDWRLGAWLAGVITALVGIAGSLAWALGAGPGDGAVSAAMPEEQTVLTVLTDDNGSAVAAAVVGVNEDRALAVMTPRDLVVDVPGKGKRSLAWALSDSDAMAAVALSDTIGVEVDGTWMLTCDGLAKLVDSVGGVTVPRRPRPQHGDVLIDSGEDMQLNGTGAADFVEDLEESEAESTRLARFASVLAAVIDELPEDDGEQADAVRALGTESRSTLPAGHLAHFIGVLRERADSEEIDGTLLPVVKVKGGTRQRWGVNSKEVGAVVTPPLEVAQTPAARRSP